MREFYKSQRSSDSRFTQLFCLFDEDFYETKNQKGVWQAADKKCFMKDLITNPTNKIAVWIHSDGTLKKVPSYNKIAGSVTCECNKKQCGLVSLPCTCSLPACDSSYGACAGNKCTQGIGQNFNECDNSFLGQCYDHKCMYAKPCGLSLPPDGYVIEILK